MQECIIKGNSVRVTILGDSYSWEGSEPDPVGFLPCSPDTKRPPQDTGRAPPRRLDWGGGEGGTVLSDGY